MRFPPGAFPSREEAVGLFTSMVVRTLPLVPKPIVGFVAKRYVAGERLSDAIATIRRLHSEGASATLDILGESVTSREKAEQFTQGYIGLFDAIQQEGLNSTVSAKPTMLGLSIDPALCAANLERIVLAAKAHGNALCIDMEDRSTTDATLRMYAELLAKHGHVSTVLQAYMRRTLSDIDTLPAEGASIRLCKGIYIEPRDVAWKDYATVRRNYVAALDKLIRRGAFVGIATHDEYLVHEALVLIDRHHLQPGQYEFQMLLGVDSQLRRIILAQGHPLRVYVPFGKEWYAYSMRRLRENPEVARYVMRAFFGLR
jgi:proline dehydrogenase